LSFIGKKKNNIYIYKYKPWVYIYILSDVHEKIKDYCYNYRGYRDNEADDNNNDKEIINKSKQIDDTEIDKNIFRKRTKIKSKWSYY